MVHLKLTISAFIFVLIAIFLNSYLIISIGRKAVVPTLAMAFVMLIFSKHAPVPPSELKASRNFEIPNEEATLYRGGKYFYVGNSNINRKYSVCSSGPIRGELNVASSIISGVSETALSYTKRIPLGRFSARSQTARQKNKHST